MREFTYFSDVFAESREHIVQFVLVDETIFVLIENLNEKDVQGRRSRRRLTLKTCCSSVSTSPVERRLRIIVRNS